MNTWKSMASNKSEIRLLVFCGNSVRANNIYKTYNIP